MGRKAGRGEMQEIGTAGSRKGRKHEVTASEMAVALPTKPQTPALPLPLDGAFFLPPLMPRGPAVLSLGTLENLVC